MVKGRRGIALRHVHTLFRAGTLAGLTDGQLLERSRSGDRDAAELAFAALVERHGPMVLRTCRSILRDEHEARDAFQASFLILVRKSATLQVFDSLGPWLHQVARRVAACARSATARRQRHERRAAELSSARASEPRGRDDLEAVLHEEVGRLPEPYRAAVVLCGLEGLTREQAAGRLGWPLGTLQSRLARGRERLRARLARRGLGPLATLPAAGLRSLPEGLADSVARAAVRSASGEASVAGAVSAGVLSLTEGALRMMYLTKLKVAGMALLTIGLVAAGASVRARQEAGPRDGAARRRGETPPVVASVNGRPITRDELVEECLARHGASELDRLVAQAVLRDASERLGVRVNDDEVEAEAARAAAKAGMSVEAWYHSLAEQRGLSRQEYLRSVIHPALLLKKLAGDRDLATVFDELKRKAVIRVDLGQPRGTEKPADRPQADRLGEVEQKLDRVLKALEELQRGQARGK